MTVRLLHFSDIHFGGENPLAVAAAADFAGRRPVDLTVVSGDLTRYAEPGEFAAAKAWVDALPGEKLVTPGNHDTPYFDLARRLLRPWRRYERLFGPVRVAPWSHPGLTVAAFNSARGVQLRLDWSKGSVSGRQRRRAAAQIVAAPAEALRVAVCHHPLLEILGGPMTARVRGGQAAARALADAGADLVLSGHIHTPFAVAYPFADRRTYAVGAGTLSLRERGAPPSFNLIEADAQEIRVIAQTWTGSHFEPSRTWGLARRSAQPSG